MNRKLRAFHLAGRIAVLRNSAILVAIYFLLFSLGLSYADVFVISRETANIRSQPTTTSSILQKAYKGDWFIYLGNSPDKKWRKIELPDGSEGWIYCTLGRIEDENYLGSLSTESHIASSDSGFDITRLEIHAINVRQGDSTLIVARGNSGEKAAILFDAGKPGRGNQFVVPYLKSLGISNLTYVISSHHDSDHTGGLDEVLTYIPGDPHDYDIKLTGKAFATSGEVSSSQRKEYEEYENAVKRQTGEQVLVLIPPTYLPLARGITIQAVTGGGQYINRETTSVIDLEPEDANAKSIGLLVTYSKFKLFVAGDLGGQKRHKYIENKVAPYVGDIDVLRVSHHGSETSTHEPFLSAVKPEVAIISTGGDNNYGHPRKSVIQRLKQSNLQMKIYQTDEGDQGSQYKALVSFEGAVSGNIVIRTDGGCSYSITGDGPEFSGKQDLINDDCL